MSKSSLGVAYATKRRNKKPKGYAKGGVIDPPEGSLDGDDDLQASEQELVGESRPISEHESMDDEMLKFMKDSNPKVEEGMGLEEGSGMEGKQPSDGLHDGSSLNEDIVDSIMHARKRMAEGGMVEDAGDSDTVFAPEDAFNQHGQESNLKEDYSSDLSNEDHDQSIIGQILSERKKKRS